MTMVIRLLLIVHCVWFMVCVSCYMMSDFKQLLNDTLHDYNKDIRPLKNQSEALVLRIGTELAAIVEYDEVDQKLSYTSVMRMQWYDESMVWDPNNYGGLEQCTVNSRHFWLPSLVLTNTFGSIEPIKASFYDLKIRYDGKINMAPGRVFYDTCDADVTYFPWDLHVCELRFLIWEAKSSDIVLESTSNKVGISYYAENRGWSLENTNVEVKDGIYYDVTLYLRRRPLFVLINVISPTILLSFLNILTFLIPTETGERLSYSITILLAISVFLTIVGEDLPKISNPMAIFSYYLLAVLAVSACAIFTTLISLNLYHKVDKPTMQEKCDSLFGIFKRKRKSVAVFPEAGVERPKLHVQDMDDTEKSMPSQFMGPPIASDEEEVKSKMTGKEISVRFDRICFVLIGSFQSLATIIFFCVLYSASG